MTCQGGDYTNEIYPKLRESGWQGYWIDAASSLRMKDDAIIILDPVNQDVITDGLAPDGRVWLTSGIGNAPTWLLRAKKVIIELNHYHDPRVAELADIVIPGAPPRRNISGKIEGLNQTLQITHRFMPDAA